MDGVAISIIERPRPLTGHDMPNPANNTYTLKCEEPLNDHEDSALFDVNRLMSEANQAMTEARADLDEDPLDEFVRSFRIENEQNVETQLNSENYF